MKAIFPLLLIAVLLPIPAISETADASNQELTFHQKKLTAIDAAIEQAIHDSQILGATFWLEHNGTAYHRAYGQRAAKPTVEDMTDDTIFDLASITKVIATTSAAMLCIERGQMGVDDLVSKYLPEFTGEGREKITIRHLLLHSSGLPVNLDAKIAPFSNPADAFAQACRTKLRFAPGSHYSYSSAGSMVLGALIEQITGQKLNDFCTESIFQPLGMSDTLFRPQGEALRRVAPTSPPELRGQVNDTAARVIGGVAAHASLFSTTADLARFARMMLHSGDLDGVRIFAPETVRQMTSVQSPPGLTSPDAAGMVVRRGLGWDIDTPYRTPPHHYTQARGAVFPIGGYGHTGWTGQMLWIDPFSQTFVIFLCNRYVPGAPDSHTAVARLHYQLSTLAAEAVKGFDFDKVPEALPSHESLNSKQ